MPASEDMTAWERLGELLEQRRVTMNPRWRNLRAFERERGIDWRLAWDLEHAKRTNYRPLTLKGVEAAYGWRPGSIAEVLAGGEPSEDDVAPAGFSEDEWRVVSAMRKLMDSKKNPAERSA